MLLANEKQVSLLDFVRQLHSLVFGPLRRCSPHRNLASETSRLQSLLFTRALSKQAHPMVLFAQVNAILSNSKPRVSADLITAVLLSVADKFPNKVWWINVASVFLANSNASSNLPFALLDVFKFPGFCPSHVRWRTSADRWRPFQWKVPD